MSRMGNSLKERHHVKYLEAYGNRIIKLFFKNIMEELDWMLLAQC
jgi:hypothetical protein